MFIRHVLQRIGSDIQQNRRRNNMVSETLSVNTMQQLARLSLGLGELHQPMPCAVASMPEGSSALSDMTFSVTPSNQIKYTQQCRALELLIAGDESHEGAVRTDAGDGIIINLSCSRSGVLITRVGPSSSGWHDEAEIEYAIDGPKRHLWRYRRAHAENPMVTIKRTFGLECSKDGASCVSSFLIEVGLDCADFLGDADRLAEVRQIRNVTEEVGTIRIAAALWEGVLDAAGLRPSDLTRPDMPAIGANSLNGKPILMINLALMASLHPELHDPAQNLLQQVLAIDTTSGA
jgi:hypothetical protein